MSDSDWLSDAPPRILVARRAHGRSGASTPAASTGSTRTGEGAS